MPDDHFMVIVTTKRPEDDAASEPTPTSWKKSEEETELIIVRLASMSTSSPTHTGASQHRVPMEIEYVSGRIKRLAPVPLPLPVVFVPLLSSDSDGSDGDDFGSEEDDNAVIESSKELVSQRPNPQQSYGYPDSVDLSSGNEWGGPR